jgi:hypothetical protein
VLGSLQGVAVLLSDDRRRVAQAAADSICWLAFRHVPLRIGGRLWQWNRGVRGWSWRLWSGYRVSRESWIAGWQRSLGRRAGWSWLQGRMCSPKRVSIPGVQVCRSGIPGGAETHGTGRGRHQHQLQTVGQRHVGAIAQPSGSAGSPTVATVRTASQSENPGQWFSNHRPGPWGHPPGAFTCSGQFSEADRFS